MTHCSTIAIILALLAAAPAAGQTPATTSDTTVETYRAKCAPCHGPEGVSLNPQLGFVSGQWKQGSSVKAIATAIRDGVPGTPMMAFKHQLEEKEILALARYVRSLDRSLKPEPASKPK